MSNRHGQGIATWLIMVPLVVVPLIAVFGVPKMSPIATRTADGADGEELPEFDPGEEAPLSGIMPPFPGGTVEESPQNPVPSATDEWTDPFDHPNRLNSGNRPDASVGSTAPLNSATDNPFSQPNGPSTAAPPDAPWTQPGESRSSDSQLEGYSRQPSASDSPAERSERRFEPESTLTWRQAVARLNELGVQKFQLSQTDEPFVFQFVCDLSRRDNPRVTHRFHAKAGEPLKAVENVIEQVESWSAQQTPQ